MQETIRISSTAQYAQSVTSILLLDNRNSDKKKINNKNNNSINVAIQIQIQSQCLRPYFIVRLAGPALIGMDRMQHFHPDHSKISGVTYEDEKQIQLLYDENDSSQDRNGTLTEITLQPVAVSGTYDVEIVQLLCNVDIQMIDRHCIPNTMDTMMLNTPQQVYLETSSSSSSSHQTENVGHWERLKDDKVDIPANTIRTRFQLAGDAHDTRLLKKPDQATCSPTTSGSNCDHWWYDEYGFVGQDTQHVKLIQNKRFCFLGDSHNLRLSYGLQSILSGKHKFYDNNNIVSHFNAQYPTWFFSSPKLEFQKKFLTDSNPIPCTDVLVAMAQWPLSLMLGSTSYQDPDKWIQEVSQVVDYLHVNTTANIILQSIHYIPLGLIRTSCPPLDWRMPYFVDVYNERLRRLYKTHPAFRETKNIFIDTNPILGPVWDTANDYNHNSLKESIPEAIYLLKQMMILSGEVIEDHESSSPSMMMSNKNSKSSTTSSSVAGSLYTSDVILQQTRLTIVVWCIIVFFFLGRKLPFSRRGMKYFFHYPSFFRYKK